MSSAARSVVQDSSGWWVLGEDGRRLLGPYPDQQAATAASAASLPDFALREMQALFDELARKRLLAKLAAREGSAAKREP